MRRTALGAILITVIWLAGVFMLVRLNWPSFSGMEPNAWGDFLAGSVASPLALIWLVASYMQQGDDLRLNTKALLLQQKELAEQVAATKQLAVHAEQQAAASTLMVELSKIERKEREHAAILDAQPKFIFDQIDVLEGKNFLFSIENTGMVARGIAITSDAFEECSLDLLPELLSGYKETFMFMDFISGAYLLDFGIDVEYTDVNGSLRAQSYRMKEGYSYLVDSWGEEDILSNTKK